jgi:hypothetical protein
MTPPHSVRETRRVRVPDDKDNFSNCYCPGCPTYTECMTSEQARLFCARGRSQCPIKRLGCECGECTVAKRYALSMNYYCDIGRTGDDGKDMNV